MTLSNPARQQPKFLPIRQTWASRFLFGVVALFISVVFVLPASAQTCGGAAKCSCGDMLLGDRKLTDDPILTTVCPSDGLIIAASGVTLDLKTKILNGSGKGAGVLVLDGVVDVTITGEAHNVGRIQGFGTGIRIAGGASDITVIGVQAYYNTGDGILVEGDHNTITSSPGRHNGNHGHAVMNGNHNVIMGANNEYNGDNGFFVKGDFKRADRQLGK